MTSTITGTAMLSRADLQRLIETGDDPVSLTVITTISVPDLSDGQSSGSGWIITHHAIEAWPTPAPPSASTHPYIFED